MKTVYKGWNRENQGNGRNRNSGSSRRSFGYLYLTAQQGLAGSVQSMKETHNGPLSGVLQLDWYR